MTHRSNNYGRNKKIEEAKAAALERRKAEGVQQDGTGEAGSEVSENTEGAEGVTGSDLTEEPEGTDKPDIPGRTEVPGGTEYEAGKKAESPSQDSGQPKKAQPSRFQGGRYRL